MRTAITGGVAEGKSTVLEVLRKLGRSVAQSDTLAAEVLRLPEVQDELSQRLGLQKPIDTQALRPLVWSDPAARRAVNGAIHGRTLQRIRESEAEFIEVPLLIEACLQGVFDRVWVVTCGPEEQRRRLSARVKDQALVERILGSQLQSQAKTPFADLVIRTNADVESVQRFVTEAARPGS